MKKTYEIIKLSREKAIILLVRLQNADIPYVHSSKCRQQMSLFLAILLTADEYELDNYFIIKYSDMQRYIEDAETAYKIIKQYGG